MINKNNNEKNNLDNSLQEHYETMCQYLIEKERIVKGELNEHNNTIS